MPLAAKLGREPLADSRSDSQLAPQASEASEASQVLQVLAALELAWAQLELHLVSLRLWKQAQALPTLALELVLEVALVVLVVLAPLEPAAGVRHAPQAPGAGSTPHRAYVCHPRRH
jgi:hypothetical protein